MSTHRSPVALARAEHALIAGAALMARLAGCAQTAPAPAAGEAADLVLFNARVYTLDEQQPWAQAVAVRDGQIIAVGSDASLAALRDTAQQVVDLGGRLLLPAFGDAHAHPVFGGISFSRCSLHKGETLEDYQAIIRACIEASPGDGVVSGVGWSDALFPPNGVPRKEVLDAVSTTRPLIFDSVGGHSTWLNSKGLEVAGITRDTPDPANGHIDRDPVTGEPVGGLQEAAMLLVSDLVPPPTLEDRRRAIVHTARHFNSLGITSFHDAGVEYGAGGASDTLDAYRAAVDSGELTARVAVGIKWRNELGLEQIPDLVRASERVEAMGLVSRSAKFYVDGVIPQQTAYMLAPYAASTTRGAPQVAPELLAQAVTALDALGFQAHAHAIGDGGVRASLDAMAAAREANGAKGGRHMVSHLNVVDPQDQPRFGQLGVTAQLQPLWASHYDYMDLTRQAVGPQRSGYLYPAGSIARAGGRLAYGADWPVGSANPLEGLEVALTRTNAAARDSGPLLAGEAVTLEQAVRAYTIDAAWVNRIDHLVGSVAVGKRADLVLLDHNIFELPADQIGKTQVLLTLFDGRAVHGRLDALPAP